MTITIKLDSIVDQNAMLDIVRDSFPEALSVCIESDDGTSTTILPEKS